MKTLFARFGLVLTLAPFSAFAVDGVVLINQATVTSAGGFPYVIATPGSYKLSGNLNVPAGKDGIQIHSSDVSLDLNGFTIAGAETTGPGFGIASPSQNITLRNGAITNFSVGVFATGSGMLDGIHAGSNGTGIVVMDCSGQSTFFSAAALAACTAGGYSSSSTGFIIVHCSANLNHGDGFEVWNSTVSDSMANRNSGIGFYATASSIVHNIANGNLAGASDKLLPYASLFGSNTFLNNTNANLISFASQSNNLASSIPNNLQ